MLCSEHPVVQLWALKRVTPGVCQALGLRVSPSQMVVVTWKRASSTSVNSSYCLVISIQYLGGLGRRHAVYYTDEEAETQRCEVTSRGHMCEQKCRHPARTQTLPSLTERDVVRN